MPTWSIVTHEPELTGSFCSASASCDDGKADWEATGVAVERVRETARRGRHPLWHGIAVTLRYVTCHGSPAEGREGQDQQQVAALVTQKAPLSTTAPNDKIVPKR